MYILKNAFKNIIRSKGRNILIGIITLVIATSCCLALTIKQSAKNAEENGLQGVQITATVSLDRQAIMKLAQSSGADMRTEMTKYQNLTLEQMQTYAKSKYVKDFTYKLSTSVSGSDTFKPVDTSAQQNTTTTTNTKTNTKNNQQMQQRIGEFGMGKQGDFSIVGYSKESSMTDFVSGTSKITDGSMFTEGTANNDCIISDELATLNSLKVGDSITVANPNLTTETYVFKIVGIYNNSQASTSGEQMRFSTSNDPANQILTSYNALSAMIVNSTNTEQTSTDTNGNSYTTALRKQESGTYIFSDVSSFDAFKLDAKSMGLADYYTVSSSDVSNYDQSILPLKNLSSFADTFLILVLVIGGIILVVLNIFNIRERKYEVGVLTAIGMKKWKVASQFILELFMVTLIATVIGTSAGAVVSVPTANQLLQSQITQTQTSQTQHQQNFGRQQGGQQGAQPGMQGGGFGQIFNSFNNNSNVNYLSQINATVNFQVVLQLVAIGLGLAILASLAAVIFILRYEPLKILTNRT